MELPTIKSYGEYSSDNYGAHCLVVSFPKLDIYYSYETPIAFRTADTGFVIRENDWSTTTGKHLNWLDEDKKKRISGEEFEKKFEKVLKKFRLV